MASFSPKQLEARHAIVSGFSGDFSIEILMRPFFDDEEIVDTSLRLDGVNLVSGLLRDLVGKTFEFPVNPDEGYIDGSIYLKGAHHPADVTSLQFNESRDGKVMLIAKGVYVFDFEGLDRLGKTPFVLAAPVSSTVV
jgi:hypothetical protein